MFRTPTTTPQENEQFYQSDYSQGFTSEVPNETQLKQLIETKFEYSEKCYAENIAILRALGAKTGDKILDFGCSWGYGSWQLRDAGFDVSSFEISKPRCKYAREKLGVKAFDELAAFEKDSFDFFFSSHVLEHVPSVNGTIEFARSVLKPGGVFISFTPNGSPERQEKEPAIWSKQWGMVHPNFLDSVYFENLNAEVLMASSPYEISSIRAVWKKGDGGVVRPLVGAELLTAFRMASLGKISLPHA